MISFDNVSKSFAGVGVLDHVTLRIAAGERVALVGPNGAGKTTLIRCLLGEYVHQGNVTVGGLSPRPHRRQVLCRIGFVPQQPPPLKMPVGELIRFAAGVTDSDPSRIIAVSKRLGFEPDVARSVSFTKLSGGQKQKLLIAIALGRDDDILIMDEPAANLDPQGRRIFFELLAERGDRGIMLLSSHRLDEVAALVNRVVELDCGKVTLDDRVADEVSLSHLLDCEIGLSRQDDAVARALRTWGFDDRHDGLTWDGQIAGPDRLRFLGILSRYAGLLTRVRLDEKGPSSPQCHQVKSHENAGA